jgi:hypothetical protein
VSRATYAYACVDVPYAGPRYEELMHVLDHERPITRATFVRNVDAEQRRRLEASLGYAAHPGEAGLRMRRDRHVSYGRSVTPDGRRVYFARWSAIEYLFIVPADHQRG